MRTALVWPRGALLTLAVLAFCAVGIEGGMYDWCGVYLRRMLDAYLAEYERLLRQAHPAQSARELQVVETT